MLSRPSFISDEAVARAVAAHWLPDAAEDDHLPWGFGAHHWRVTGGGTTVFVTLDQLEPRHTEATLEAAYAGAAALAAAGAEAVCAPLPAPSSGRFTVGVEASALSVTPWLDGRSPTEAEAGEPRHVREVEAVLATLHRAAPPPGLRHWAPQVGPEFPGELRARTARPWTSGPLAERARAAIAARDAAITLDGPLPRTRGPRPLPPGPMGADPWRAAQRQPGRGRVRAEAGRLGVAGPRAT